MSIFSVNVLSTFGTPCLMMSISTLFIGFDVVSCVLICLATLGIVVGLVDFCFLLSILCVLLILSRLIRATISVFFVPCCPVLLSFYLSYLTCLNLIINGDEWNKTRRPASADSTASRQFQFQYLFISRVHLFYDIQCKRIRGIPFIVKSHNKADNKSKCIF